MLKLLAFFLLPLASLAPAQTPKIPTLKGILLQQLHTTHDKEDWFVPVNIALKGLTPEQAAWKDPSGNHSIGQLANHLLYWDERSLVKFRGEKPASYNGNNDETFNNFNQANWNATVQNLNRVLTDWEKAVEAADDQKLLASASTIAHIGTHNAYHLGQIIYIRKLQGSWNPAEGVK